MVRTRDRRLPSRGLLVASLLLVHTGLLAIGAWRHSPTWTEVCHLPAGISHWQLGVFDLYHVNPPLVRMVAALPILLIRPKTDWASNYGDPHSQAVWEVGRNFMYNNGYRSFWLMTVARWACIPFALLGGWLCYRWARELYGTWAGLLALSLWCFDPAMIGHGQLIATDAQGATLGVAVLYLFWRWLHQPTWTGAVGVGVVLGLAELTRTTWIILYALFPIVWACWRGVQRPRAAWAQWRREAAQGAAMLLLGLYVLNLGYGFEGTFQRLGEYQFVSRHLAGNAEQEAYQRLGNRFAGTWLGAIPLPLPKNYVQGFDYQKWDFERERWSYLRGEWRTRGWWYYYLYALGIKEPLGTWLLMVLAVVVSVSYSGYGAGRRNELFLLVPIVAVGVLVSSQTGLNKHMRYMLPVVPFMFIWGSKVGRAFTLGDCALGRLVAAGLTWSIASGLWIYPHSLSYFNELVGGPRGGPKHLLFSNISWGQDLLYLRRWYDRHPEARPLAVEYDLSLVNPLVAGIEHIRAPRGPAQPGGTKQEVNGCGPQPGWYAMNINRIMNNAEEYQYFLRFEPADMAGYSTYIYHISEEEANRVRRELGLPEIGRP